MIKIKILSIGKTKETWLDQAINEYIKRLSPVAAFEFIWAKDDKQLLEFAGKESAGSVVCLDAAGSVMTSEQFSSFLISKLEQAGSRLTLIIGGSDGLPLQLKRSAPLISLSPMTFTHQITRLVLMEQIYRAFEIAKGSPYHK